MLRACCVPLITTLIAGAWLSGCGDSAEESSVVSISHSRPIDLDPAGVPDARAAEVVWLVYTPLLTYRHAEGREGVQLLPGLAEELPEISPDGTEYSLSLRDELQYSDGTAVEPGDFEHAIKRALHRDPASARSLGSIAGVRDYLRGGDPQAEISGIEAGADGEISISLRSADPQLTRVLAMPLTAPVPTAAGFADLSRDPPPGVGAYAIGEIEAGGGFTLERSSTFAEQEIPEIPVGAIDTISVEVIGDREQQAQAVLDNKLDYMQDRPPAMLRPTVLEQASDRYDEQPRGSSFFSERIQADEALFHPVYGNDYSSWVLRDGE